MALDAALMECVRAGAQPVLRFYRWSPPCLSLGRNQPARGMYDPSAVRARGIDVVRRPTGGRAVLHDRELTYSVVMADRTLGAARTAYSTINRALVAGLRRLGVAASLQASTGAPAAVPSLAPCFREAAEGEVVVNGRKLVGSAQVRQGRVLLQHGSLLLQDDQTGIRGLLLESADERDEPPITLSDCLPELPPWNEIVASLAAGWEEVLGPLSVAAPSPEERRRAEKLAVRFAEPSWTWRR